MEQKFGFIKNSEKILEELEAVLMTYTHEATGLKLFWLKREDENKTFGIGFSTPPEDDTGVFHILEHSVLGGSEKYPVKEPFLELVKNSLNTFLNAMTFPDKTFYPVCSRNDKDFINLTRVYLDGVFRPLIYTRPEIFLQEGWHYEFNDDGTPVYNGVVFSEMKGAFADPEEILFQEMQKGLFPDTAYRFCSGGDPAFIPELTCEIFLDTHRRFYSPSNAAVFLDGPVPIDTVMRILDEEYLAGKTDTGRVPAPVLQPAVDAGTRRSFYELSPEEDPEGKTRLAIGYGLGSFDQEVRNGMARLLAEYLGGSNQAPLTRAVLEAGLAEDVDVSVQSGIMQPWVMIDAINLRSDDEEKLTQFLEDTIKDICENGLDREKLEALIANAEFAARERDSGTLPKGINFGVTVIDNWLYGAAPEASLQTGSLFADIRKQLETGGFEALLKEIITDNRHKCRVILHPSAELGEERRKAEEARILARTSLWDDEELDDKKRELKKLKDWQNSEDTKEQLESLPHLSLEDVRTDPADIPTEREDICGISVLSHKIPTGGISYVSLYFDASDLSAEELPYLSFLAKMLGKLSTERTEADRLISKLQLYCGSTYFAPFFTEDMNDFRGVRKMFLAEYCALDEKLEDATALITEILTSTLFEPAPMAEFLKQFRQTGKESISSNGHSAASARALAMNSSYGACKDLTGGFSFYQWLSEKEGRISSEAAQLSDKLQGVLRKVLGSSRLTVSVTGKCGPLAEKTVRMITDSIPLGKPSVKPSVILPFKKRKEGIITPSDVGYAARYSVTEEAKAAYGGIAPLAARIVSYAFLWNEIRVLGGAYGTGCQAGPGGMIGFYSYRDPACADSLAVFDKTAEFLRGAFPDDADLTGFIIGTISDASPVLTPRLMGNVADHRFFSGISYEMICRNRRQLLKATPEKLRAYADIMERAASESGSCVVGGRPIVESAAPDVIYTV